MSLATTTIPSGRNQPSSRLKSPRSASHGEMSLPKPTSAMVKRVETLGEKLPVIQVAPNRPETANMISIPPKKALNLEEALLQKETEQKQKKEKERLEKLELERRERIKGRRNLERSTSLVSFMEIQAIESTNELSAAKLVITADGQIEYWSENCEKLLGWSNEEISGKDIVEFIPEMRVFLPHLQKCVECEDDPSEEATPSSKRKIFWTHSLESILLDKNKRCVGNHKDLGQVDCEMYIRPVRTENGLRFAVNIREVPIATEALLNVADSSHKKTDSIGGIFDVDLLASRLNEELQRGVML